MRAIAGALSLLVCSSLPALADDAIRPDPRLTPGAVATTDTATVCHPGYSRSVRHTLNKLKHEVYVEYGVNRRSGHYEIDHLIPLGLGGADVRANLWPESRDTKPWNAGRKDDLEDFLHKEVCAGRIPLEQAQSAIREDWIAAYERYLGKP